MESGRIEGVASSGRPHWTFGGALLYSVTLLTTVGYGRLSPKTALGKVVAIIYAIVGVPLMLILLSALGSLLASGTRKSYSKLCCRNQNSIKSPSVGYHKAPSSPSGKHYSKAHEDSTSIHMPSTPNHHANCFKPNHLQHYHETQEIPKRAVLATVRTNRTGWRRQGPIRQTLAEAAVPVCPTHARGAQMKPGTLVNNHVSLNSSVIGVSTGADLEEEDTDENEHVCCTHDTPSRMPLIYRCPENSSSSPPPQELPSPSVPALLVVTILASYVCVGAIAFSSTSGWGFLDAIYFCFIALSTIGVGDKLPQSGEFNAQMQLYACCLYVVLGLVVVSMCFSLVQEEVTLKCRQIAHSLGLLRH